jgi:hypothetical protein
LTRSKTSALTVSFQTIKSNLLNKDKSKDSSLIFVPNWNATEMMNHAGESIFLIFHAQSMIHDAGSKNTQNCHVKSMMQTVGEKFSQLCHAISEIQSVGEDFHHTLEK